VLEREKKNIIIWNNLIEYQRNILKNQRNISTNENRLVEYDQKINAIKEGGLTSYIGRNKNGRICFNMPKFRRKDWKSWKDIFQYNSYVLDLCNYSNFFCNETLCLYRTIILNEKDINVIQREGSIIFPLPSSCTTNLNEAIKWLGTSKGYIFKMKIPKGTPYMPIEKYGEGQSEVFLPAGYLKLRRDILQFDYNYDKITMFAGIFNYLPNLASQEWLRKNLC
tara:strand:+ start:1657 stop:2325 length:669 start_codon:yes stop_codon:yes gene_type:complete